MFFVMMDHEKSCASAETLEDARAQGQVCCDSEMLPTTFSIYNEEEHVEDLTRTDGKTREQVKENFEQMMGRMKRK